jgi:methylated-DNA-[protein]-cysteine S-methyltransferase
MTNNNLFFSTDHLFGIKFDIITSSKGIKYVLINKNWLPESNISVTRLHKDDPYMFGCFNQLEEYFERKRKTFELPLEIIGTDFQKIVWNALIKIKYGKTISYKELALRIGNVKKIRAVAQANGANPLPILIPCHRVIGSNGNLVGYGGGLDVKEKLLKLEGSRSLELFG